MNVLYRLEELEYCARIVGHSPHERQVEPDRGLVPRPFEVMESSVALRLSRLPSEAPQPLRIVSASATTSDGEPCVATRRATLPAAFSNSALEDARLALPTSRDMICSGLRLPVAPETVCWSASSTGSAVLGRSRTPVSGPAESATSPAAEAFSISGSKFFRSGSDVVQVGDHEHLVLLG